MKGELRTKTQNIGCLVMEPFSTILSIHSERYRFTGCSDGWEELHHHFIDTNE